jgi:hypothetical protein
MAAIVLAVVASALPNAAPAPAVAVEPQPCNTRTCEIRVRRKHMKRVIRPYLPWLNATGKCESGNNPETNTGNGYLGEHQWLKSTWYSVVPDWVPLPHLATRLRQRYAATVLVMRDGPSHWPVCGVRAAGLLPG